MFAENRRAERREEILDLLEERGLKLKYHGLYRNRTRWYLLRVQEVYFG
jgi:hypothetical protein